MKRSIKEGSNFGRVVGWNLVPLIVKSRADDIRQEELAYRLVKWFQRVFSYKEQTAHLWLRPYIIVATTHDGGCLELMPDSISVHALKEYYGTKWVSLAHYFEHAYPEESVEEGQVSRAEARSNFVKSLVAYSIVCYVLAIRDRHNGNILLAREGHLIHIDYGFMLCGAPGGKMLQQMGGFEPAGGFKLTREYMEVIGDDLDYFRDSFVQGMIAVRAEAQELLAMLQLSMLGMENYSQACFKHSKGYPEAVVEDVRDRLKLSPVVSDEDFETFCRSIVDYSIENWRTATYDRVQYVQNGIQP